MRIDLNVYLSVILRPSSLRIRDNSEQCSSTPQNRSLYFLDAFVRIEYAPNAYSGFGCYDAHENDVDPVQEDVKGMTSDHLPFGHLVAPMVMSIMEVIFYCYD